MSPTAQEQALLKALPLLCRADIDAAPTQLRAGDGTDLTPDRRAELLAKCKAGELVEVEVDMLAYEQRPGKPNRRFVRFRDGAMLKLGTSDRGTPSLRDHEQDNALARAGTVTRSATEKRGEGDYALRQTHRLTAPWAVELALRDLLDRASIAWNPTGPIDCSVCGTQVLTACYHFPGDRVTEAVGSDGAKQFMRDRNGKLQVEWVYSDAELTETSFVSVPGVASAGIEQIRASLSASLGLPLDDSPPPDAPTEDATPAPQQSAQPTEDHKMPDPTPTETLAAQTAALEASFADRVDAAAKAKLATLSANVKEARKIAKSLAISEDAAEQCVHDAPDFAAAKLAILGLATKRQDRAGAMRTEHVEVGAESHEKQAQILHAGMVLRMLGDSPGVDRALEDLGVKAADREVRRASKLSLMDIGELMLEARGGDTRQLRGLSRLERAQAVMGAKRDLPMMHTLTGTGDLSVLVGAALRSYTKQRYTERRSDWKNIAKKVNLPDFESTKAIGGGNFPPLLDVPENGTYVDGGVTESSYDVQLGKGGRLFPVSWELILADRWGRIMQLANDRVLACTRYEDRKFQAMIVANKMADGTTDLFSSGHLNIAVATGVPSITTLESGRQRMVRQKGEAGRAGEVDEDGEYLKLQPKFWMLGTADYTPAAQLLGPGYFPTAATSAPTDPMKRLAAGLIEEPFLDDQSPIFSILAADPDECVSIQYGYLDGAEGPTLDEEDGFTTDGKVYKVRLPFYVAAVDHRGLVKINRS